ncbi:ATP-dependent DNA helicase RecQ [Flavobacterium tructae]|uniref:RecQ family ATP-dependent DNA helicase n=1 Tax=Flavobacterium TaxID=237 RepID=UPI00201F7560|nr:MULTISPECIES: ATP-dependent DNA helicase RecQ [Flavobacterium]MDL2143590.1 ATP-dependent DNA helicase RecQ [Flavobacterium tructae]URC12946.1 RecQ family ATP-dependent DNA helicase [Flavobacterium sp. B183]
MPQAQEILSKYWKHDSFRPLQKEIIDSVLDGQDTFALLPTGGGKSICFQVPSMMLEGICLVISPLVALMKDQVANLQKRNIKAIALTGGIHTEEIIDLLDNCQYGNYKFLYLSPERLQSDWILERIKNLPINLIAIDEAHCISQWGHDFRPAYLKISELKKYFPKIPFLALTATATPRVIEDIKSELGLKDPVLFQQSFERKNIAYMVFEVEDKLYRTEQILKKNPQPSIIYVRNRKSCINLSTQLQSLGFTATYYHGGLSAKEKDKNMQLWMSEQAQVIVATNAFGMGIDKDNVKTVIHTQLPENLENYYQESGRAGRNGEKAFSVLLFNNSDATQTEQQFLSILPDKKFLKTMYIKLCNYFQIAYGEGLDESFSFKLNNFCNKYDFPTLKTYNALQFLNQQGIITLSQEFSEKITLQFIIESKEVIRYMNLNSNDEEIILAILRTYPGVYDIKTPFNLSLIAKKSHHTEEQVLALLEKLKEKEIIEYKAKNNDSTVLFNEVREDELTINRVSKYLEKQNELKKEQLSSVLYYIKENKTCKNRLILDYFGEETNENCGVCSYCITLKGKITEADSIADKILYLLKSTALTSREIQSQIKLDANDIILVLQQLLENNHITILANNKYTLKS